ncbi:phosphatidylinositol 4,5-bisphosphate-binding protein, partial [Cryomyces antarcticus]
STAVPVTAPSRSGTLKKKSTVARKSSLKRDGSTRSRADSTKGAHIQDDSIDQELYSSPFHTPIPTTGTPTEILANRFQAWRGLLKNLITYFREVQSSYEHQSKALLKVSNVINNTEAPTMFITDGGLNDAT